MDIQYRVFSSRVYYSGLKNLVEKHSNYNYLLVQSLHSKERTLDFFLKRFSVSALIIFWLAVWLALTVSSLITKRFVKGNIRLKYLANYEIFNQL